MHRGYDGAGVSYTELEVLPDFSGINTLSTGIIGGATRGPLTKTKITSAKKFRKIFGDPVEGDWGAWAALKVLKNSNCIWYKRVVSSQAAKGHSGIAGKVCKYVFVTKDFDESLNGAKVIVTLKPGSSHLDPTESDEIITSVEKTDESEESFCVLADGQKVKKVLKVYTTGDDGIEYTQGLDYVINFETGKIKWLTRSSTGTGLPPPQPAEGDTYKVIYILDSMVRVTEPDRYDVVLQKNGQTLEKLTNLNLVADSSSNILVAMGERSDFLTCELGTGTPDYLDLNGTYVISGGNAGIQGLTAKDYIGTEGTDEGMQDFLDVESLDISTLIVPGVFDDAVIFAGAQLAEKRGDIIYIPDIPQGLTPQQCDKFSRRKGDWTPTLENALHLINSKFLAMYYPWILEYLSDFGKNAYTPPSGWVASQFAYNDTIAHTWWAPAGFQNVTDGRGILQSALGLEHNCTQAERDILYADDNGCVNPIVGFVGKGITLWGNKTCLRCSEWDSADSSWTQLSVRRLCNYCRKCIIKASMETLFQPNTETFWFEWRNKVEHLLEDIKQTDGIEAYRVEMDRSTISDEDLYYGRAPGKVFILPVHAIEWIPITFTVTHDRVIFTEGNTSVEEKKEDK